LLDRFHIAALIQATVAHQLAEAYGSQSGVTVLSSVHPRSGARHEPDELLQIYASDTITIPIDVPDLDSRLVAARAYYREKFLEMGFGAGFSDDEVDFFNADRFEIAIGKVDDGYLAQRYGSGLLVLITGFADPNVEIPKPELNRINDDIADLDGMSQLGPMVAGGELPGIHMRSYLDRGFLARIRGDGPEALGTGIINAAVHCGAAVRSFLARLE
jgi:hypothetical protein